VTPSQFSHLCQEMAEFYDHKGYTDHQIERLYRIFRNCEVSEIRQALDHLTNTEMKMPNPAVFRMFCLPAAQAAARRKRDELYRTKGVCGWCQGTGMVIVVEQKDVLKTEKTMRCGECQIAEMTGVLRFQPSWTRLGSKGIEPTIVEKSMTANPSKGRLAEIKLMAPSDRYTLLKREPWIEWCLMLYGNKSIPKEPVNKPKYDEDDWE